jgi:hypothetical protein
MPNLEHGYTIDDMIDPVPMQSQSGDEGERSLLDAELKWRNGTADAESPVPLDPDLLALARNAKSQSVVQDIYREQMERNANQTCDIEASRGPGGPTIPKAGGWLDRGRKSRDSYRPGSTSSKLRQMNDANKRHYAV